MRARIPAETTAAFHAPAETPTVRAGSMPRSASASIAPIWNAQRADPPERTYPTRRAWSKTSKALSTRAIVCQLASRDKVLIGPLVISPGKAFTEPLFVLLTIALLSLTLGLHRARPRRPVVLAMVAMALLWIVSTRAVSNAITRTLIVSEHSTVAPQVIV